MTRENQKLLVQLSVQELQELIAKTVTDEMNKLIKVIQMIPTETDEIKVITREETAKLLNVSLTTLYLWNKNNILKNKKINSRVYYLKNDVINKLKLVA
jgi:DNA invertase Pin-like site-specific DNA recombinase